MTCTVIAGAQFNAHPSKISKVPTLRWALPCVSFVAVPTLRIIFFSLMASPTHHQPGRGNAPVYQIDFSAVASGKRIASSKRRVRW